MRVWDVHPGYLSRKRLLGQHAEIHGVWSVLTKAHQGYSHHPETKRWRDQLPWLAQVHNLTAAEMQLRGFNHHSPVGPGGEPLDGLKYVDSPFRQFVLLRDKQSNDAGARIPLPRDFQEFWRFHEYAVMAQGEEQYKSISAKIKNAGPALGDSEDDIQIVLKVLRLRPQPGIMRTVLQGLAESIGLSSAEYADLGALAMAIYSTAGERKPQVQAHSVLTDALALQMGGEVQ